MGRFVPEPEGPPDGWMVCYSGRSVNPLDLRVEDIVLDDIAWSLAHRFRYGGHACPPLTVAEHCLHVSLACPPADARWGLLHDAAEAYLGDLISPIKYHSEAGRLVQQHEARALAVICKAFGLPPTMPPAVHWADLAERAKELPALLLRPRPDPDLVSTMSPAEAYLEFVNRWRDLTGDRRGR